MITGKLSQAVYLNLSLKNLEIERWYPRLPTVKSRTQSEQGERSYILSKSKLEMVHQRDEFWLDSNTRSRGSIDVVFKLRNADLLPVKEINRFSRDEQRWCTHPHAPINF